MFRKGGRLRGSTGPEREEGEEVMGEMGRGELGEMVRKGGRLRGSTGPEREGGDEMMGQVIRKGGRLRGSTRPEREEGDEVMGQVVRKGGRLRGSTRPEREERRKQRRRERRRRKGKGRTRAKGTRRAGYHGNNGTWDQRLATTSPSITMATKLTLNNKAVSQSPELDMNLFDWSDYEDEQTPEVRNGSQRVAMATSAPTPCDHHRNCPLGSCCEPRLHRCSAHNRGLNNKCFDDCMCSEGLRCFAKYQRRSHVTRRKGRCVDAPSTNREQGSFLSD
ncbi:draxin [Lampetra fluviatilis]